MDTMQAFIRAKQAGEAEHRVFDWDEAARLIAKHKPEVAEAGLSEDWEWTGGEICRTGKPIAKDETYTYLSSNWATPALRMDGEEIPCWRLKSETPGWVAETYWPESALAILGGMES